MPRIAVLIDPIEVVEPRDVLRETEAGARRLGLQLQVIEIARRGRTSTTAFAARARDARRRR